MLSICQPTPQASNEIRSALKDIRYVERGEDETAVFQYRGRSVELPAEVVHFMLELLEELSKGQGVTLTPLHAELTTQKAADILNVSRPFLVQRLEKGEIPFRKVGAHRRIRMSDLLEYKAKCEADSKAAMDELAAESQKLDLGY